MANVKSSLFSFKGYLTRKGCGGSFFLIFFMTYFLVLKESEAAFEFKEVGARASALSGAYTALCLDASSPYWNPAGLGALKKMEFMSFYNQLFSLKEINFFGSSFALPTSFGTFGMAYSQLGTSLYKEQEFYLSHGIKLVRPIYLGYSLKGMFLTVDQFGIGKTFSLDAGMLSYLTPTFTLGLAYKNLNRAVIGKNEEPLPQGFIIGMSNKSIPGLTLTGELERITFSPLTIKTGIEYEITPSFKFRSGFSGAPLKFSGGFGLKLKKVELDYAYLHHETLLGTHAFSLYFKSR
ncbi:MAG: hypothetical protein A3I11_06635 [Elusimicrobia bacterium RIFCSPLOWO2_02_FULL_39_32]|nr:MAG: hypothetical protein A2034_03295 [Elusimicrobia bacterium GWA2_38_7]OGR81240.1 MAG: hypothetical protein A3B80_09245 [Elusimicrobia bacterium RIFCSPHIGHO2_02_FULL_39_36]OGR91792.1 MAG: hypothetical protein A3I11_06635 [Elusimicrobia bacterium RIFCSPLOWO2_02_FULL_39_32]OGR98451.1 MAG: hypothetical protein A3G85_02495 [Elusimicrobia bacterium RIFCSPLOWO2_12_FULL_39_28]